MPEGGESESLMRSFRRLSVAGTGPGLIEVVRKVSFWEGLMLLISFI